MTIERRYKSKGASTWREVAELYTSPSINKAAPSKDQDATGDQVESTSSSILSYCTSTSASKVSKMKLTFSASLGQVLLAFPVFVTAVTLPYLQERAPTDEALNSTTTDLQARQGAPCTLHTRWIDTWRGGAYERRRVRANSEGSGRKFTS